jgi:hypothetical protein
MTVEQYDRMFKAQKGVCAICGRPPKTVRLAVDHNHKTGKVRGLLCFRCNFRIVRKWNVELLRKILFYLETSEQVSTDKQTSRPKGRGGGVV